MKLELELRGCYGIKELTYSFNDVSLPLVIHAPNGTMKTSLKRTFDDLSVGAIPKDLVSGAPATNYSVRLGGAPVSADCIKTFAYEQNALSSFDSDVATMLASDTDKVLYQKARNNYQDKRKALLQAIKSVFSNKVDFAEKTIEEVFGLPLDDVLMNYLPTRLSSIKKPVVAIGKFSDAFGKSIAECIKPASEIIKKYDTFVKRALKKGGILKKGVFELSDLEAVAQTLESHRFYDAGHKTVFTTGAHEEVVGSMSALENLILEIKKSVSSDAEVVSAFADLQSRMSKRGVDKKPLKLMESQPLAASYYADYDNFQKRYVLSVFQDHMTEFKDARLALLAARKIRRGIAKKAARSFTEWKEAADEFNRRFNTKYKMVVRDAQGDFMTGKPARIEFVFDGYLSNPKQLDEVKGILSSGELRALFLLDVVFQTKRTLQWGKPCLLLYDDISDAFDYANKNCIMEYFYELSLQNRNGCMLVLTHNFHFYRLFASRISDRSHAFFALSDGGVVQISQGGYLRDVLNNGLITKTASTISASFALIPFARGIVELTTEYADATDDPDYEFLCELMHYRPTGARLSLGGVKKRMCFNKRIQASLFSDGTPLSRNYYAELKTACSTIATSTSLDQKLEDKLCLALGIRVFSEKYCYRKLTGRHDLTKPLSDLLAGSFGALFDEFKIHYPHDFKIKDLRIAKILTSADLHLNGFAYEPLIDYSIVRMRSLYRAIAS